MSHTAMVFPSNGSSRTKIFAPVAAPASGRRSRGAATLERARTGPLANEKGPRPPRENGGPEVSGDSNDYGVGTSPTRRARKAPIWARVTRSDGQAWRFPRVPPHPAVNRSA